MENYIYIKDEEGNEIKMVILFTFDADEKHYVICHKEGSEEYLPFIYDENGNIEPVEDPEEFAMVEEVFNTFDEELDEEDL